MTPDRREQLYDNLINSGRLSEAEIGTKEQFRDAVKDEETVRKFYNNLKNSGLFDESEIGTEDQFYDALSPDFEVSDEFAPYPEEVREKFLSKENQSRRGRGPKKSIEELYEEYDKQGGRYIPGVIHFDNEWTKNLRSSMAAGTSIGGSVGDMLSNARQAGQEAKQEVQTQQPEQPVKASEKEAANAPLQRDPAAELNLLRTAGKYAAPVGQTKEVGGKTLGGSTAMGQAMKNIEDVTRAQEQEKEVQDILEGKSGVVAGDDYKYQGTFGKEGLPIDISTPITEGEKEEASRKAYNDMLSRKISRQESAEDYEEPSIFDTLWKSLASGAINTGAGFIDAMQGLMAGTYVDDPANPGQQIRVESYDSMLKNKRDPLTRLSTMMHNTAEQLSKEAQPKKDAGFLDMLLDRDFVGVFQKGLAVAGESLPYTLSAYNPYTLAAMGISMAGSNFRQNTLEDPDAPEWLRVSQAIGSAAIEQAVEKYADPVFKYVGGKKGADATIDILKDAKKSIKERITGYLKSLGKDAAGEGAEEVITNLGNDALGETLSLLSGDNRYSLRGQYDKAKAENPNMTIADFAEAKAKENIESFIGGALSGAYMSATAQTPAAFAQYAEDKRTLEVANAINGTVMNAMAEGHYAGAQSVIQPNGDPHGIQTGYNVASASLDAVAGEETRQRIDDIISNNGSTEELTVELMNIDPSARQAAVNYINARSSLYGAQDAANEDIQSIVEAESEAIAPNILESVDEEGNAHKAFTTVNYGGQMVYVRNYDPTSPYIHIVDDATGEVKQIIRGQDDALDESSIQTYDYDQYMRDFERNTEASIGAELEERMAHNAKTDTQMAQGSMIGSENGQMYVFANDGQTVQLLPTKANAETGQMEPVSGQPIEMSVEDAVAMQDGYYDTKDYPIAEAAEEAPTQEEAQEQPVEGQEEANTNDAEAAVNAAGQALIDAGLGNEKDLLDEGGTIDTTAYDDEQLALMQQYANAVNAYNNVKNSQQEATNEAQPTEPAAESKIPVDEKGNKLYEQAPAGDTYDDIVASVGEPEDAMTIINGQIAQAQAELDKLQKQKKDGKLKGKTVQEQIDAMKALNEAIKAAQERVNYWTNVLGVPETRAKAGVTEETAPVEPQDPQLQFAPTGSTTPSTPEESVQKLFDSGAKFEDIRTAIAAMPEDMREAAQAYFDAHKDEVLKARRAASVNAARKNTIVEKFKAIANSENASFRQKVAGALFNRGFIWDTIEEAGVRMRGINAELFGGGERPADKEKYRNWIASRENGGATVDEVAHTIWEGVFGTDSNETTETVKNEIIDLLREFPVPIEMAESIVTEEEARIESELQAEKDAYAQSSGFSSWQDMEIYNELGAEEVNYIPNDAEDSEIFSIFAEENENQNENEGTDNRTETGTDTESSPVDEGTQQPTVGEGSTGVQSGTQADNEGASEQGEQGRTDETGEQGSDVSGNGEGEVSEREKFIAEHPLTEAEIDASDAPNARKNSAKRYLNGIDESPLAKAAYLSIYNKKPKITATEPETAGTTDESNAAADAAKAKLQTILARLNQHKKKPNKDGVNEYSVETLTPEQVDDMLELVEAGAEYGYQILDAVSSKKGWKEQISDVIKEPLQNATGYNDEDVADIIEDMWNAPYSVDGQEKTVKEWAEEKGIDINDNENGNEEGNGNAGVQAGESGSDTMAGTTEGSTEVSDTDKGSPESAGETGEGTVVSGGNSGSSEGRESEGAGRSGSSSGTRGTSGTSTGSSNTGRSNGGKRTNDGASTGRGGKSDTLSRGGTSVGRGSVEAANDTQSSQEKLDAITKEKVPYRPASAGEKHAIGSVVPSGIVDAVSSAFKRLKESLGKKSVLDFVRAELGYKTSEEMLSDFNSGKTDGLASEQVDAVALAIQAMKNGRSFIVGDMTGVGKGRTAAALIRWGLQHKKKVLFITEKSGLFSDMHRDLTDIGCNYLPFVTNSDVDANITDADGNKVVPKPSKEAQNALWQREDDKLPRDKKGRQYDFVMTTYSQASNPRGEAAKAKLEWLKNYAKDAIVIMDESHNASGESNRGNFFRDIVEEAGGVTFLSATYAKRPDNMILYALKSSMKELNISVRDMLDAIKEYGVAMQELMASSLFGSGEMIRRERDMSDVKTTWEDPKKVYSEQEYEECRKTSDKTMQVVNDIIDFQREFVNPIVREHEREYESQNAAAALAGAPQTHATNTSYKSQVSNILGLIVYSMKAKKAAEMAIEQIKAGKKPVIAVENTLGSYVDELDDAIEKADFAPIFAKGIRFALRYSIAQYKKEGGEYKKDKDSEHIFDATSELSEDGQTALRILEAKVKAYLADQDKIDLTLSPIDLIKKMIVDAGYNCGEITGRSYQLVQQPDGTYTKEPLRTKKKEVARKFNGGSKTSPIDEKNQYQALVLNVAGATGISLHSSKTFGNQQPRTMIILQPARDVNTEVQMRGRIDRTGQVHRGEYFYLTSPIPAEQKLTMMLKQKLASLDAQSVGTKEVSSNRVDSQDMDNKYGDEVCYQFLLEHLQDINAFLDNGLKWNNKTKEWEGHPGLLYDVLKDLQRMGCDMQEKVINELSQRYADQIDYLNQNGINDLETAAMNLEAVTIDKAVFINGKNNGSPSEFAHDTNIERVEVNVLKKPMRSSDITKKMKDLGSLDEEGLPKEGMMGEMEEKVDAEIQELINKREQKNKEKEEKHEALIRSSHPKKADQTDEEYENMIQNWPTLLEVRNNHDADLSRYTGELAEQKSMVMRAAMYLKPGQPCLVPLTDDVSSGSASMYGRFLGFQSKNGDPRQIKALFAVKDSRSMISVPIVNQNKVIDKIISDSRWDTELTSLSQNDYGEALPAEEKAKSWNEWWDRMIPKNTNRQIRYMITGNVVQACGSLGKYKGQIVTFTRKNPETGEITLERGMLLAENFDPENFRIRRPVEKKDIWDSYNGVDDELTKIYCYRSGDRMYIRFNRQKGQKLVNHPALKDDALKEIATSDGVYNYGRDALQCEVTEENVEKMLKHLLSEYGYAKEELFVMPDSTEKPDAIVRTNRPYQEIIDEYSPKYGDYLSVVQGYISKAVKRYKMDVNNDSLKEDIRKAVQLRQALLRKKFAETSTNRLAWKVLVYDQEIEAAKDDKYWREKYIQEREAALEELEYRGSKGNQLHLEQGKMSTEGLTDLFNSLNDESTEEGQAKKVLFDKIMNKVRQLPSMEIILNDKIDNGTGGMAAGRMIEYNWKYMNADYISDQAKADTILHELIHTVTSYAALCVERGDEHLLTSEMVDAINELQNIYDVIKKDPRFKHDGVDAYGFKNLHEMLAEAGSNSQFREDLKNTGLWAKIKSGILRFFGIVENVMNGKKVIAFDEIMDRLDFLIENFSKEAWEETYRGTVYGSYGQQLQEEPNTEDQDEDPFTKAKRMVNERWAKMATPYIENWSEKLGVPIRAITDIRQIPDNLSAFRDAVTNKKDRAWYVTYKDGSDEVIIYVPNTSSYKELDGLIMHEVVAHKGMKGLLGEDGYKRLCLKVYDEMTQEEREKWKKYGSIKDIEDKEARKAQMGDEYIANLAENIKPGNSAWDRIVSLVRGMLRKMGLDIKISDAELSELIRESYNNLTNPDPNGGGRKLSDDLSGKNGIGALLDAVNKRFNEKLQTLTEGNADSVVFNLGRPSDILVSSGVKDMPMKLYGNKIIAKAKKHGFDTKDLVDLPVAVANPIAVFNNYGEEGNRAILTELKTKDGNILVTVVVGKGGVDIDFNVITSVFGKSDNKIIDWFNKGYATYINKEKALNYLHHSEPITEALSSPKLNSAAKVINEFVNPPINAEKKAENSENNSESADLQGRNGISALLDAVDRRRKEVVAFREATSTPQGTQSVVTSDDWDREASDASNQLRTIAVDMYTPLLRLQQLLEKKLGIKITDSKNAHQAMLNLSSVNLSEMGIYDRLIGKRLSDAAIALMGKKAFKKDGSGMDTLNDYMYAKHAVERNREKAMEDFANSPANTNPSQMDLWYQDKEAIYNDPTMTWREKQEALDALLESYGVDYRKTPSMGLAAMFGMEEKDDWRSEAYDYVEAFERTKDPDALQEYWNAVHAATDYILDKGTASGLYEQGYKERQHRRWQYYVPLRGFDEVIAQDVYAYVDEASKQSNNSLKAVMRGRKSKAGNIFGGIVALGYGSIIKGNENLAKQRFMNLAREAQKGGSSLMKVNETWAVQYGELANYPNLFKIPTDGTYADDEYVQAVPNINDDMTPEEAQELLAAFYDKLEELEADDKSVKLHGKGRIPYRTLFDQDKQHQVTVYENGRRYTVTMLGDNAAAQAINNMLNPGRNKSQAVNVAKKVNRFMSANFTSRNPAFAVSNVIRDSQFSANNVWVKENLRYFGKFLKNLAENYATVLPMFVKYQASGNALGSSKTGRMFKEFMDHGGPIGYTFTESQQDYAEKFAKATREQTKQIEKIKDLLDPTKLLNPKRVLKNILEAVEEFAEASELINRFAAYKTSREMGRSISRSILDAHEVSINFAQKGAGTSWQSRGQGAKKAGMDAAAMLTSYGQNFIVFYNANIQGRYIAFDNFFGNLGRGDKGKAAKALFSQVVVPGVAGGFGIALLNDVILPAMYEALGLDGDDDDDKYYDMLNDYVRQNKICLRLPGHRWATIPLDPEAVPMWTIGDILYNMCNGKDVNSDDIMRSMVDAMSPSTVQWERKGNQWVSFIPSLIQPVADLVANQNFLGYSIYKEDPYHKQGGVPKFKMVYSNTSESLVKLSELSNMLGGGNDVEAAGYNPDSDESNAFDWNPATVQHILKGFVGGIPETILGVVDASMSMLTGGSFDTGTQKIPLISRFYVGGDPELEDKRIDTAFEQVKYGYERGEGVIKRYDKEIEKAEKENNPIRKAEYRAAADKTEDKEIYRKYGQLAESGVMKKIKTLEEKDIPKAEQSGASADEINDMKNTLSMLKQSVVSYMKTIGENYEMPDVK